MAISQFGRYQIQGELGRGGMATVYLAYDPHFQRQVALKVLPAGFLQDPEFKQRFQREALILAQLEHNAIVPVYDYGEDNGCPYLVMRLMKGGSLKERLLLGPLSLTDAGVVMSRICAALDKAHTAGIVHRDLKPGNILFDEEGAAYLADFGIARLLQASHTFTAIGTPQYLSPEQGLGMPIDGRTDVYQMGVVYYEMVTGRVPYNADTPAALIYQHAHTPTPLARALNQGLPKEVDAIIGKAMSKDPDQRYRTTGDLSAAVNRVAVHAGGAVPSSVPIAPEVPATQHLPPPARPGTQPIPTPAPARPATQPVSPAARPATQPVPAPPAASPAARPGTQPIPPAARPAPPPPAPRPVTQPIPAGPAAERRRKRLPWLLVLGGGAALLLLVLVVGGAWLGWRFLHTDVPTPTAAVVETSEESTVAQVTPEATPTSTPGVKSTPVPAYTPPPGAAGLASLPAPLAGLASDSGRWTLFTNSGRMTGLAWHRDLLWLATTGGLVALDPATGESLTYTTYDGLIDNRVLALAEGPDGALWVGAGGGVSRFDSSRNVWQSFPGASGLGAFLVAISDPAAGAVWFGGDDGLSRFDPDSGALRQILAPGELPGMIVAGALGPDGALWLGTDKGGLVRYDPQARSTRTFTQADGLLSNRVYAVAAGPDGAIWIGTDGGVTRYDPQNDVWQTFTAADGLAAGAVMAIAAGPDGAIWVSALGGLSRYELAGAGWSIVDSAPESAAVVVWAISAGPDGALWLATSAGLRRLDPATGAGKGFPLGSELCDNNLSAVATGPGSTVWLSDGHCLNRYDPDRDAWTTLDLGERGADDLITSLRWGSDDALWLAWWRNIGPQVDRFDPARDSWRSFTATDGLPSQAIDQLAAGPDGELWVHSSLSLYRYSWAIQRWDAFQVDARVEVVQPPFAIAPDGTVWLDAGEGSLAQFDPAERVWRQVPADSRLGTSRINALAAAPDNSIWLSTWGAGVARYDPAADQWTFYTAADGLGSSSTTSIHIGPSAAVWVGHLYEGASVFDPAAGTWQHIAPGAGIGDGYVKAIVEAANGDVWFATAAGASRFQPR